MHKTLLTGATLTLFAAAMGASGTAAAIPLYPSIHCTAENEGEITTVESWRLPDGYLQRVWECAGNRWLLVADCDGSGNCIYY